VKSYLTSRAYTGTGTFSALSSTAQVLHRVLPGAAVLSNEKLLYVYYFQTSKYNTLADKFNNVVFKSLDHTKYWGIHESNLVHFGTDEDLDAYDVNGYDVYDGFNTSHQEGLVHVDAHVPSEPWFNSFVWPMIYAHVQQLAVYRLWDQPLADRFTIGLFNPFQTASFVGASTGKLYVPAVDNKSSGSRTIGLYAPRATVAGGAMMGMPGGFSIMASPQFAVSYLHGDQIGSDYFNLWWKCHAIMMEYGNGGYNDPESWLYGLQDWVDNNSWWIGHYSGMDLNGMNNAYQFMKDGFYTLDFIYSPKFTWFESGPWIKKQFRLGNPPKGITTVRSSVSRSLGGR
jgi:hypothetical protein